MMKRGITSIILALVLALGPAGSIAAAEAADPVQDPSVSAEAEVSAEEEEAKDPEGGKETEGSKDEEEKKEEPKAGEEVTPEDTPKDEEEVTPEDTPKEEEEVTPGDTPKEEEEVTPGDTPKDEEEVTPEDAPKDEEEVTPEDTPKDEEEKKDPKVEDVPAVEPDEGPADTDPEANPDEDPENKPDDDPEVFKYTIVFDGNGATSGTMKQLECDEGKLYTLSPNVYVRTGYDFTGWNTKTDGTGTSYQDKDKVKDLAVKPDTTTKKNSKTWKSTYSADTSVTLYAQWKETPFTVTYFLDGGTNDAANPTEYTITTDSVTLKNPVKKCSVFEGWYSDDKFTVKSDGIPKGSTGEMKFYAKWREYTYTIIYDGNGATSGNVKPREGIKYSEEYTLKANKYKKKGYTFTSWNTNKKGTGTGYEDQALVQSLSETDAGQVTLYAQWEETAYKIKYHLKGGRNNADNPSSYTVKSRTIKLKAPKKTGYTFLGWYKDPACTQKITKIKKGRTGDIDVYAKWQVNKYTVEYIGNGSTGGRMRDTVCRYGREYTLRANKFVRTGYTFKNWNRNKKGTGKYFEDQETFLNWSTKDGGKIRLYAQWKPIKYKVKFYGNGATSGSMNRINCTYDVEFSIPKNKFKRDGYNFKGWSTEPDGSGNHYDDTERVENLTSKDGEIVKLYARWEYDSDDDEATIWNFLSDKIGNDYGAAGVMGNLFAESGLRSNNLENMYNERLGLSDEEYTRQVDSGEYGNFANDHAGYGIAQWTFYTRKQGLLDYARDMGTSIANLHTQLGYMWKELTETYSGLLEGLRSAGSVREASDMFMRIFENPADQSEGAKQRRAGYGWNFFNKFH